MRIRTKLIAVFLTTALLAFGSVLWLVSLSMRHDAQRSFEENSAELLLRINDSITQFFTASGQLADFASKNPLMAQSFGHLPSYVDDKQPKRVTREQMTPEAQAIDVFFAAITAAHKEVGGIYIGLKDGGFLEYPTNTWPGGHDPRKRPWYDPIMKSPEHVHFGRSYLTPQGVSVSSVNAKVISPKGELLGAIGIDIPLQGLVQKAQEIKIGQSGYMMLLEDSGVILADPRHPNLASRNISEGVIPALKDVMRLNKVTFRANIDDKQRFVTVMTGYHNWKVVAIMDEDEVFAATNEVLRGIFLTGGVALLLLAVASLLLARNICQPISTIVTAANKIAEGDLNALPRTTSFTGEMREMHQALLHMVTNLAELVKTAEIKGEEAHQQTEKAKEALEEAEKARIAAEKARREGILTAAERLESSANIINDASLDLENQVAESEQGATRQAARIAETATAMEEMNCTVLEVARNAGTAADMSAQARTKAEEGATLVKTMVTGMGKVEEDAQNLKRDMSTLGQHAQAISQIMGVISDIADQTNLLALNAAIEAARAGDAGRGFAVVADEVRKLAEKTMASTTDVSNAIKAIQQSADASIRQVEATATNIAETTGLATTAGQSLIEIVEMVEKAADQVRTIATAAEEQSATSEEINRSIMEVSTIAAENAETMKRAARDVGTLASQASALNGILNTMKQ